MSHIFPPGVIYNNDKLAPEDLNRSLRLLEDKFGSGMGEQDIATDAFVDVPFAQDAVFLWEGDEDSVDMDMTGGVTWAHYDNTGALSIENTDAWQTLITKDITTGNELLKVLAGAQLAGFLRDVSPNEPSSKPYRVQLALYVDDLLEWTITGQEAPDPPYKELYKATAAVNTADWDYRHLRRTPHGWGLSNHLQPARLVAIVPVIAGSHTIALRGRRIPRIDGALDDDPSPSDVQCFNRQLYVLRCKDQMLGGAAEGDETIAPVESGTLSASVLNSRLTSAGDYLNDLPEEGIRSGALRADHLPTSVKYVDSVMFDDAASVSQSFSNYSGRTTTNGDTVEDSLGNKLRLAGAFDFRADGHGVVEIQANILVWRIWDTSAGASSTDRCAAVFKLVFEDDSGADVVVAVCERFLTPRNEIPDGEFGTTLSSPQGSAPTQIPCEDDVALLWVADTSVLEDDTFDWGVWKAVRIDVEGWAPGADTAGHIQTKRANLSMCFYPGVRLA